MSSKQTQGDGWDIPPMIDVTDPGRTPAPIKAPSVGMRRVAYVTCPLGVHQAGVVNDGVHVRYATHHAEIGGGVRCSAARPGPAPRNCRPPPTSTTPASERPSRHGPSAPATENLTSSADPHNLEHNRKEQPQPP